MAVRSTSLPPRATASRPRGGGLPPWATASRPRGGGGLPPWATTSGLRGAAPRHVFMDPSARQTLLNYSKTRGMTKKTAFSLDGLNSQMWRIGATAAGTSPKYEKLLTTSGSSTMLVCERMIQDNEGAPDVLRKPLSQIEVDQLFLMANFLTNSLADAKDNMTANLHNKMVVYAKDRFLTSSLDSDLLEYATARPEPQNATYRSMGLLESEAS